MRILFFLTGLERRIRHEARFLPDFMIFENAKAIGSNTFFIVAIYMINSSKGNEIRHNYENNVYLYEL